LISVRPMRSARTLHLFKMAQTQRISYVPPDTPHIMADRAIATEPENLDHPIAPPRSEHVYRRTPRLECGSRGHLEDEVLEQDLGFVGARAELCTDQHAVFFAPDVSGDAIP